MRRILRRVTAAGAMLLVGLAAPLALRAEDKPADKPPQRWMDTAELSFVSLTGNAKNQTFGFKNKLWRVWDKSSVEFNAGGVRAETTTFSYEATGTPGNFSIARKSDTATTAEAYFAIGRYDRKITERFFWFAGAGWDRNRFAGIQNRYAGMGGIGNIWADTDHLKFRTDYSFTYTKQDDVVSDPDFNSTFLGARFSWNYLHKFGASTVYTNDFAADDNLDSTADYRLNMTNSVAVAMSKRLALKVSLQNLYDNRPSFAEVNLTGSPGVTVLAELEKLDRIFTASLVVNF